MVKIDPKGIGIGQYQHDMKQARLDEALGGVVESCVNAVGVDINTASYSCFPDIAGINRTAAKNIVKYREENGAFTTRAGDECRASVQRHSSSAPDFSAFPAGARHWTTPACTPESL